MLPELENLEPERRSGVLSRAALDLDSNGINPDSSPTFPHEVELRKNILERLYAEVRVLNPVEPEDKIKELVIDKLDEEASIISDPVDVNAALERLSRNALLPSDAYHVAFSNKLTDFLNDLPQAMNDRDLVLNVLKNPDAEQNYGRLNKSDGIWTEISILAKWFNFGRPRDRFLLIITGRRSSVTLTIFHIWRIYESDINVRLAKNLPDLLQLFSITYGRALQFGDWNGKFLLGKTFKMTNEEINKNFNRWLKSDTFATCMFLTDGPEINVAFALSIFIPDYIKDVKKHLKYESNNL